jgi:plastocyanin
VTVLRSFRRTALRGLAFRRLAFRGLLLSPLAMGVGSPAAVAASAADRPATIITLRDHKFDPADIELPAGAKMTLVVRNAGTESAEFESHALHREKVVKGGGEISLTVGPLKPGSYEFFDDFHPATRGRLIVR